MAETHYADNDGVRIAYEVRGEGDPLLLAHGLGYARTDWEPVIDALAERRLVIAFDNRGIGESDVPDGPYRVSGMADDALAVLDEVGVQRTALLGASLGGAVAQEVARGAGERVERLVLCCPLIGQRALFPASVIPVGTDHVLVDGREALRTMEFDPEMPRRNIENALSPSTVEERPELVDRILELRIERPMQPQGWLAQDFAGAAYRYTAEVPDLDLPVLVLHGEDDAVISPQVSGHLEDILDDVRVARLADCGHMFWWEQPERFVQLVADFLG